MDINVDLCIIGFGVSGIALARHSTKNSLKTIVLEKNSSLGGCWFNKSYENTQLQTSKYSYSYEDLPMDQSVALHPSNLEILSYLKKYVKLHKLNKWVRYKCEATNINWVSQNCITIKYKDLTTGIEYLINTKYLGICSGFYTNLKKIRGLPLNKFNGTIVYSPDFSNIGKYRNYPFSGKNVVVIGNGPSGCDMAVNSYKWGAKSVTLLYRSDRWIFNRYYGNIGFSFLTNRFFLDLAKNLPNILVMIVLQILIFVQYFMSGFRNNISLPNDIVTRDNLTLNEDILSLINKKGGINYIKIKKISKIQGNYISYWANDHYLNTKADIIIFSTGYNHKNPILNDIYCQDKYKRIIDTNKLNIGYIGFSPSFNWVQVSDLQSKWFIDYILKDKSNLISKNTINRNIESIRDTVHKYKSDDLSYLVYSYMDELKSDLI